MGLWKAFKEALDRDKARKQIASLTYKGLDMEALKEVAKLHEKYIEIVLRDGTLIKIWSAQDLPNLRPDPTIW
jgi:hypothetical protein